MTAPAAPQNARPADSPESAIVALNAKTRQRQRLLLLGGGGAIAMAGLWFVLGGSPHHAATTPDAPQRIETDGIVNRDLSQKEFVAIYGNRLDAQARQLKTLEEARAVNPEVQSKLDALAAENQAMRTDGAHTIDALTQENTSLRGELARAQSAPPPPSPTSGVRRDASIPSGSPLSPHLSAPDAAALPTTAERQVKTLSFVTSPESAGTVKTGFRSAKPQAPAIEIEDSPDYLPPNSYAPARVIVGVDASAGVVSQTDPLPVVLRITGPARSVVKDGKLLTTRLEGCVVNGAARGDLSAEKVYVKLQKMTCDQPGGRVAVSEVKGFISFAGKTGVRGRVVSREGSLVSQALIAGIVGGFGRGFSANANGVFSGLATGVDGKRQTLSPGDIVQGAGEGQEAKDAAEATAKVAGVAKVLLADDAAYAQMLAETVAPLLASLMADHDALVCSATSNGKNIAPRVAAMLDVTQVSEILSIEGTDTFTRPIYAGNAIATVRATDAKKVLTVRATAFAKAEATGGSASVEAVTGPADGGLSSFVGSETQKSARPELTSAKVVVSGGRALGSAEKFHELIDPLADKLHAAVGASRAAVDAGYAPNDYQVGQTGKIVAPEIYVAVGISGAIQHLAGMKDAKTIIAINKDEDAPIFQVADVGLVGDLFTIVPTLTGKL